MIEKLLIANRGEIACRILRTCRTLGIRTVAVYSDADAHSLHVEMADEAYPLGANAPQESYLHSEKILRIAQQANVDAIHPGYGFLSENADFAQATRDQGLIFIGPSSDIIKKMGNKDQAKAIMEQAGVPVIPGYHGDEQTTEQLVKQAEKILPVMIKAAAGGGGKGMRIVYKKEALKEAIESAKRESLSSFGDDRLLLEKYLTDSRHIEVQVIADHHGHAVHLFERDCSLQRRHQKIIEEAPASALPEKTRKKLLDTAVKATKAIGYTNAGTFEFLYTPEDNFYFLEMNTRLQVEHPVTEMITGIDLVAWQIQVACEENLPLEQAAIQANGHAIEARLYAENPANHFLPSTGELHAVLLPELTDTRFEIGVKAGDKVGIFYDPMLAKVVVWGETRLQAIQKLKGALAQVALVGVTTNLNFLREILNHQDFQSNQIHTHYLEHHYEDFMERLGNPSFTHLAPAVLAFVLKAQQEACIQAQLNMEPNSPWFVNNAWQLNSPALQTISLCHEGEILELSVQTMNDNHYFITCPKWAQGLEISGILDQQLLTYKIDNKRLKAQVHFYNHHCHVFQNGIGETYACILDSFDLDNKAQSGLTAPMPGVITKLWVTPGTTVDKGDKLLVMEAMKMEHTLEAHSKGVIKTIFYKEGDLVDQGTDLFEFDDHGE